MLEHHDPVVGHCKDISHCIITVLSSSDLFFKRIGRTNTTTGNTDQCINIISTGEQKDGDPNA